jgi:hypothetical protein
VHTDRDKNHQRGKQSTRAAFHRRHFLIVVHFCRIRFISFLGVKNVSKSFLNHHQQRNDSTQPRRLATDTLSRSTQPFQSKKPRKYIFLAVLFFSSPFIVQRGTLHIFATKTLVHGIILG